MAYAPATSSSSSRLPVFSTPPLNQLLNQITSIKLDRGNYLLWQNLALPILRSYKLEGHLTGEIVCPPKHITPSSSTTATSSSSGAADASSQTEPTTTQVPVINPKYDEWRSVDQLVLGWLYNSMTAEVATQVMGYDNSHSLWEAVQELFGIQSRAEEDYLRQVFQQTKKGSLKMTDYLRVMKTHADNLGQAGSPVPTRALISQVLLGLEEEFNPVVAVLQGRANMSWVEVQNELLVFEKRLDHQNSYKNGVMSSHNTNVNMAQNSSNRNSMLHQNHVSRPNLCSSGFRGHSYNPRGGRSRGRGRWNNNTPSRQGCQVCGKPGHSALSCFHRFNKEFFGASQMNRYGGSNTNHNRDNVQNQGFNSSNSTALVSAHNPFLASSESVADANWYVDSGASSHVTADNNNITHSSEYDGYPYGQSDSQRNA